MSLHLNIFVSLFAFMLVPAWIPILGSLTGRVRDRLMPRRSTPAQRVVEGAKARTASSGLAYVHPRHRVEPSSVALPLSA